MTSFLQIIIPLVIVLILTPLVRRLGVYIGAFALENKRTVHHGKIARIGGVAIYIAFMIGMVIFYHADDTINGILIGSSIVFFTGLIDDLHDIKPLYKFAGQSLGALVTIFVGGVCLSKMTLPFDIVISNKVILTIITYFWMVGVTNAINLIDGLDGLSCGTTTIVLTTMSIIAFGMNRFDVMGIALIMIGALLGFLRYNFHPASIFVGDCGALFIGFIVSCISLIGFKSTTMIALILPLIILFVPLADTTLAIIRRKIAHKSIGEADKGHTHHKLMYDMKLGHVKTVLVLYVVTALFGVTAIVYWQSTLYGSILLIILMILVEIFVEYTQMINEKFHPILSLFKRIKNEKE
ncbi:MAG: MraY family glycosyltransferase [Erysipelotrichaceae bacterium]